MEMSMKNFRVGECYFRLSFIDPAMTLPVVDTLVFVGMNLSGGDKNETWYFQDPHSYNASGPAHESGAKDAQVFCYSKDDVGNLLDLARLGHEIQNVMGRKGKQ
jgi:hypothetical protein